MPVPLWELVLFRWLEDGDCELEVLFVIRLELFVSEPVPEEVPVVVSVPPVLVVVSRCDAQPVINAAAASKAIRYFII